MKLFDKFASTAAAFVARAHFFLFCVLLVVIWIPSIFLIRDIDTWQLIINTVTTIVTFLLVALLQNTQERFEKASFRKLNALLRAAMYGLPDTSATRRDIQEALHAEDEISA